MELRVLLGGLGAGPEPREVRGGGRRGRADHGGVAVRGGHGAEPGLASEARGAVLDAGGGREDAESSFSAYPLVFLHVLPPPEQQHLG